MRPALTERAGSFRATATDAEKRLWSRLRCAQLGVRFRQQHPVPPYILDFCCIERGLVIELDGGQHAGQQAYDDRRAAFLKAKGYTVLRFWNNEVLENTDGVVEEIFRTLGALPPVSPLPRAGGGRRASRHATPPSHEMGGGTQGGGSSSWRADFPIFRNADVAYLDSAASAQKPQAVIDAMTRLMETHYANTHRGLYNFSQETTQLYEGVRETLAAFLGAPDAREVVFTRNATEAINLVAQSWGATFLEEGDEIILTEMEHHANIVPWQMLRDRIGIVIKTVPVRADGTLDLEAFERLLTSRTMLVGATQVSNALGTVNNIKKIIEIAKDFYPDMKVLVDGSQAVVHRAVNIAALGCDFYVMTGHKLYGPTGIGALWARAELLEAMPPYQGGGDMIERVSFERTTYAPPPARFEAGTPAIVEAAGLGAAVDYVRGIGMEAIAAHESALLKYMNGGLQTIAGLKFFGTEKDKAGIVSFVAEWGHPSDLAMILNECGVAVRAGHHCCQPLMARFGIDATVRVSLGLYSVEEDVDRLVEGLGKARSILTGG